MSDDYKHQALWTGCVQAQRVEFEASQEVDRAFQVLKAAEERLRVARQYASDARGRLHLAIASDSGVPDDYLGPFSH